MGIIKKTLLKLGLHSKEEKTDLFYSYYIFGKSVDKPIWDWGNWKQCSKLLQPIIDLSPELPFIKSSQSVPVIYGEKNLNASNNLGSLRFGRMIWNEENNKKWTTKYSNEEKWTFFDTEIAFPTRSHCHKNNIDPRLLISVHNENLTGVVNPLIDQAITIHIKSSLVKKEELLKIEAQVEKIGHLLNWKIGGYIRRPISFKSEFGGYTDSFWNGSYGLLNADSTDFSYNYRSYGIEYLKRDIIQ